MNFWEFRNQFHEPGCINIHQVYAWKPDFDKNNITRWCRQNLLVKLRNGYYSFPEYIGEPGFAYYLSNRIYRPSYISLHTALAFYGMIPEAIIVITAATTLKTASFDNDFGDYSYKSIQSDLFFGYEAKPSVDGRSMLFAHPEKALLDLLYLYPFYNTPKELEELRLDEDFMHDDLKVGLLNEYAEKFRNKALEKRKNMLLKIFDL